MEILEQRGNIMKYIQIPANISGIYQINFPNGKIYVGRAKNIKVRIWEHFSKKDGTPCYFALKKYYKSFEQIDIDILEQIKPYNYEKICLLEKKWIAEKDCCNKKVGYNILPGGNGGAEGVNNAASKITEEDLENIITLLKEQKTNAYIASIYNIHPDTVGKINNGKHYYNESLSYPIRQGRGNKDYFERHNAFTQEQLDTALYLLSNTNLSNNEISKQTDISSSTLTKLNTGTHAYCKETDIKYPIRKTRRTVFLTDEEVRQIKKELLNKNYSTTDIANHFNCSRDTISDINQGKAYFKQGEQYPIRNFYPNRGSKKSVSTISGTGE